MINAEFNDIINDLTTENLYQWDSYQTLKITGINFASVTPKIHFCNKKSTEALVVQGVLKSDGSCEVSIPNSLLGEKYDIVAYIYINTGLTYKTIKSITIPIIPRLKPTNYTQPSNEQIAEIEEIELQAKAILNGLTASDYDSTKSYKRPNIVYYNCCSYMCNSDTAITGIAPTDTSKWKMIAKGSMLTNLTKDDNGNLVFTFNDNSSYTFQIATVSTETADKTSVPALKLTDVEVSKVKNLGKKITGTFLPNTTDTKNPLWYVILIQATGLYRITVSEVYVNDSLKTNVTEFISIEELTQSISTDIVSKGSGSSLYIKTTSADAVINVRLMIPYEG